MPATTATRSYPYPLDPDPIDVAGDIQELAVAVDTDVTHFMMPPSAAGHSFADKAALIAGYANPRQDSKARTTSPPAIWRYDAGVWKLAAPYMDFRSGAGFTFADVGQQAGFIYQTVDFGVPVRVDVIYDVLFSPNAAVNCTVQAGLFIDSVAIDFSSTNTTAAGLNPVSVTCIGYKDVQPKVFNVQGQQFLNTNPGGGGSVSTFTDPRNNRAILRFWPLG